MTLANLIIGNRDWLLPSLGLFAVALFVLWQAYRNTSVDRRIQLASIRSEEHTSELQSRRNLVCRLLLEIKKDTSHHL